MPLKRIADDDAPKTRKPQAPKERPPGMTNAAWVADVERRQTETRGKAVREKKLAAKRAAAADEQARLVSMAMGQPRVGGRAGEAGLHGHGTAACRPIHRSMANPRYDRLSFHLLTDIFAHVPQH
jgi:hypothetical protein